jgi:effector-binding domain-containing protein
MEKKTVLMINFKGDKQSLRRVFKTLCSTADENMNKTVLALIELLIEDKELQAKIFKK